MENSKQGLIDEFGKMTTESFRSLVVSLVSFIKRAINSNNPYNINTYRLKSTKEIFEVLLTD